MPTLTIDGRTVQAPAGATILQAARRAGIEIPTLCHHDALEPWGGCRLCVVELSRASWDGWSKVVVSCMASAEEGLIIDTRSERIKAIRKVALDLLLARSGNSALIRKLAAEYGLSETTYRADDEPTACVLCGLCTRVCESYATSAITTVGRGTAKAVGTFSHAPPDACVGCGGCAMICPTGFIREKRTATAYEIWDRRFDTAHCSVDAQSCIGCGSCEQACPFAVPRVALSVDGARLATIAPEHCRGCGACVGACPTGAISQRGFGSERLMETRTSAPVVVMACGRCGLAPRHVGSPAELIELACTGRVSAAALLSTIAQGAHGVLVLGRHESTCRFNGAEQRARDCTERARRALNLSGLDADRVRFVQPAAGAAGPQRAVRQFIADIEQLGPSPLSDAPAPPPVPPVPPVSTGADNAGTETLDGALASLAHLAAQPTLAANGWGWLERQALPAAEQGQSVLYTDSLPYLDVLLDRQLEPLRIKDVLHMAFALLQRIGAGTVGLHVGSYGSVSEQDVALLTEAPRVFALSPVTTARLRQAGIAAQRLDQWLLERRDRLSDRMTDPPKVACDGSPAHVELLGRLGFEPVDCGPDPLPARFSFTPTQRRLAEQRLAEAERRGARALLVGDPLSLIRWSLITRYGSWRASRLMPLLAHQLAWYRECDPAPRAHFLPNSTVGPNYDAEVAR